MRFIFTDPAPADLPLKIEMRMDEDNDVVVSYNVNGTSVDVGFFSHFNGGFCTFGIRDDLADRLTSVGVEIERGRIKVG